MVCGFLPAQAKNLVKPKAYMFGFVASFNDSTVYFTNIQQVDSVWFTQKKELLAGRSNYSNQLRNYCADKLDKPRRTCIVVSHTKLKKVEKKYEKMKKMYLQNKKATYDVRFIEEEDFKFSPVNMKEEEKVNTSKPEKSPNAPKEKKTKKDGKIPPPPRK